MLPIMERLLYKPKESAVTRVLVLVPTRELAVQVHTVAKQLANYTNIQITLSAGELRFIGSPEHYVLMVSFCDNFLSIVRHSSSAVNIYLVNTLEAPFTAQTS